MRVSQVWPTSPFHLGNPVDDDRLFVGRQTVANRVISEIHAGQRGAIIHGPRRFGKTSVLNFVRRHVGPEYAVATVDLHQVLANVHQQQGGVVPEVLFWLMLDLNRTVPIEERLMKRFSLEKFRSTALPGIRAALGGRRLVVQLDELEVLQEHDYQEMNALLSAFVGPGTEGISLVIVKGKRFGGAVGDGKPSLLRDLTTFSLEPLNIPALQDLTGNTFGELLEWKTASLEYLNQLGGGHPLYTVALCDGIWRQRAEEEPDIGKTRPVTMWDLESVAEKSAVTIRSSLDDIWSQLDISGKLVLRAIAEKAPRYGKAASAQEVTEMLQSVGRRIDEPGVESVFNRLSGSFAILPMLGSRYVISPVLSRWVVDWSLQGIMSDYQQEDENASEADRLMEAGREAENHGNFEVALGDYRRSFYLNPLGWEAGAAIATLEVRLGSVDAGLDHFRNLPPYSAVRRSHAESLVTVARSEFNAGRLPIDLITELAEVDPSNSASGASVLVAEIAVEKWYRALEDMPPTSWSIACNELASAKSLDWWRIAVQRITAMLSSELPPQDEASSHVKISSRRLTIVVKMMPWLVDNQPQDEITVGDIARTLGMWRDEGRDPREIDNLLIRLQTPGILNTDVERQRLAVAWRLAIRLLKNTLRNKIDLEGLGLSVRSLEPFINAAPHSARQDITQMVRPWLKSLLTEAVRADPREATAILRVSALLRDVHLLAGLFDVCLGEILGSIDSPAGGKISALVHAWPEISITFLQVLDEKLLPADAVRDLAEQTLILLETAQGVSGDLDGDVGATRARWRDLVARFPTIRERAENLIESAFPVNPAAASARQRGKLLSENEVERLLGDEYSEARREPAFRVFNVPLQAIQAFRVKRNGVPLSVRVYAVEASDPDTQAFLMHLWDTERRILYDLGTRWEGRALPRLFDARFEPNSGALLLVTESLGPITLRSHLSEGRLLAEYYEDRARLWQHLAAVFEAVDKMHDAGFLHRAIRPDHIRIDEAAEQLNKPRFRLSDFEAAVFLYGLETALVAPRERFDRYCAPEILALEFGRLGDGTGLLAAEGRATDAYSLGLLVYECLVGPLRPSELDASQTSWSYQEHSEWIQRLLARAETPNRLLLQEWQILRRLLVANPHERCSDISELLPFARALAMGADATFRRFSDQPALCVTFMSTGSASSINYFLERALGRVFNEAKDAREFIEEDLRGARIYRNRREDRAPLVAIGSELSYRVAPFIYDNRVQRDFGWLEVARDEDGPEGPMIAKLVQGARVRSIGPGMLLNEYRREGSSWDGVFDLVGYRTEALSESERRFHKLLRMMADHEEMVAAESVLEVQVVSHKPARYLGGEEEITLQLKNNLEGRELPDFLTQWFDRESFYFSLDRQDDPFADFNANRRWMLRTAGNSTNPDRANVGTEAVLWRVHLPLNEPVGEQKSKYYIRPYSLQGASVLYRRHVEALDNLRFDSFLMRAVVRPEEAATDLRRPEPRLFDKTLDESKQTLAHAIRDRHPLFCVQGPPGTGKTTLAREVVLQMLSDNPHARILVTSQSHDPLDNLLQRVEEGLDSLRPRDSDAKSRWRRPVSVRLMNEERLSNIEANRESSSVGIQYHPSTQARKILEEATKWALRNEDDGWATDASHLRGAWRRFLAEQSALGLAESIERRLVESANIVFATANDRRLTDVDQGSFDLLIYEEAGKAFPIEILSPMRLARRWLLIGDQHQLPPFDIEKHELVLDREIALAVEHPQETILTPWRQVGLPTAEKLKEAYRENLRMFEVLYDRGCSVRLPAKAPSLFGLSGRLTHQWRMHPAISGLVREVFYPFLEDGDELKLRESKKHRLLAPGSVVNKSVVWIDVPSMNRAGNFGMDSPNNNEEKRHDLGAELPGRGGGYINPFEARVVLGFMRQLQKGRSSKLEVAVLSPYRAQVNLLKELLETWDHPVTGPMADSVFTVDSFQGRQADVVILSLVRNNAEEMTRFGIGFLSNRSRANVMFSRAERLLVVVGCSEHFRRFQDEGNWIPKVFDFISANRDGTVVDGMEFLREADWQALVAQDARRRSRKS